MLALALGCSRPVVPAGGGEPPSVDLFEGDTAAAGKTFDDPRALPISLSTRAGVWTARYPNEQWLCFGSSEQMTEAERESRGHLVVPVDSPIRFTLDVTSEVDFNLPSFRIAQRVEPNRRAQIGFIATRTGEFEVRNGRERIGSIVVVTRAEFDTWLGGFGGRYGAAGPVSGSPAHKGRQLFVKHQCHTCHNSGPTAKGPNLEGIYGSKIPLKGGGFVFADEQYLKLSIRRPNQQVRDGWEAIMPAYEESKVTHEELDALVCYLRSLQQGDLKIK